MTRSDHPFVRTRLPAALSALLALGGAIAPALAEPAPAPHPASEQNGYHPSEDPQLRSELAALREKYQQDRQSLKARSGQLPPEERMRLHQELLEAHQAAVAKAEADARTRSGGSRQNWEERRERRVERLQEVRKDGASHKRQQDDTRKR